MKFRTIVASCTNEYPIHIGSNLLNKSDFKKNRLVLIADANVADLHGQKFLDCLAGNVELYLKVTPGEESKTRTTKQVLEDKLLAKNLGRDIMILAIGGGMVCDLVGFLAATYCRGVPVIYWPTSLLAMVDAAIGGKVAVNTQFSKNSIGVFATPYAVWSDVSLLKTLPKQEFSAGMVEVIKHAFISDKDFFYKLLYRNLDVINLKELALIEMIEKSCQIKNSIVSQDVYDLGIRSILNFGHTVGHAIEQAANYQIKHGEAIALGMLIETYIAISLGTAEHTLISVLKDIFKAYAIPLNKQYLQDPSLLLKYMHTDKKNTKQQINMVLIENIGETYCDNGYYTHPVSEELILEALHWAQ